MRQLHQTNTQLGSAFWGVFLEKAGKWNMHAREENFHVFLDWISEGELEVRKYARRLHNWVAVAYVYVLFTFTGSNETQFLPNWQLIVNIYSCQNRFACNRCSGKLIRKTYIRLRACFRCAESESFIIVFRMDIPNLILFNLNIIFAEAKYIPRPFPVPQWRKLTRVKCKQFHFSALGERGVKIC